MSPARESRQEHWDAYWQAAPVEEVYESVGELAEELSLWRDLEGARILEVGAGSGRDSLILAERGAKVTVLDYSPAALAVLLLLEPGGASQVPDHAMQSPCCRARYFAYQFAFSIRDGQHDSVLVVPCGPVRQVVMEYGAERRVWRGKIAERRHDVTDFVVNQRPARWK